MTGTIEGEIVSARPVSMGRRSAMTIELTACERPRLLASRTRPSMMDIRDTLTFAPVPRGTVMRWRWQLAPRGVLRPIGSFAARAGRRRERAIGTALTQPLEAQAAPPAPG